MIIITAAVSVKNVQAVLFAQAEPALLTAKRANPYVRPLMEALRASIPKQVLNSAMPTQIVLLIQFAPIHKVVSTVNALQTPVVQVRSFVQLAAKIPASM